MVKLHFFSTSPLQEIIVSHISSIYRLKTIWKLLHLLVKCKHLWSETKQLFKCSELHQKKKSSSLTPALFVLSQKQWLIQGKSQYFQVV